MVGRGVILSLTYVVSMSFAMIRERLNKKLTEIKGILFNFSLFISKCIILQTNVQFISKCIILQTIVQYIFKCIILQSIVQFIFKCIILKTNNNLVNYLFSDVNTPSY